MKKIMLIVIMIATSGIYAQNTKLKSKSINAKYENFYYKSPQEYNNQEQVIRVNKILFSSNYKGSKTKNIYQISIYGMVKNKRKQIVYNAKSIEELEHYRDLFNGRYKKILLFTNSYKVASKNYRDTSISVEY